MTCPVETLGGALQLGARCTSHIGEVLAWVIACVWLVWVASRCTEEEPDDWQAKLDELRRVHEQRSRELDAEHEQKMRESKRRRELRAWPQDDNRGDQ